MNVAISAYFDYCKRWIVLFLYTQLLVTLISLPILIHWGLPCSYMSTFGNLIFLPVLIAFILLSSFFFFTEILGIPNGFIASLLNTFVDCWHSVLACSSNSWLVAFIHPGTSVLMVLFFFIIAIICWSKSKSLDQQLGIMFSVLVLFCMGLTALGHIKKSSSTQWLHERFNVIGHQKTGSITFIDDGYFGRKQSPDKAVSFDLMPCLTKKFGSVSIKKLVLLRPGLRSFQGAFSLCSLFNVQQVVIPYFKQKLSKKGWYHFFCLTRLLEDEGILLTRIMLKNSRRYQRRYLEEQT